MLPTVAAKTVEMGPYKRGQFERAGQSRPYGCGRWSKGTSTILESPATSRLWMLLAPKRSRVGCMPYDAAATKEQT